MKNKLLIVTFIIFCLVCIYAMEQSIDYEINKWALNNNYRVESTNIVWVDFDCPFWRYKNDCVRRVVMTDNLGQKHIVYFQFFTFFGTNVKEIEAKPND